MADRRTYGSSSKKQRKRPRPEEEFSEELDLHRQSSKSNSKRTTFTSHNHKDDSDYFSQEPKLTPSDTESQPKESQSSSQIEPPAKASAVSVDYEAGLPRLLYDDFQSDNPDTVIAAGDEIYNQLSKADNGPLIEEFIGLGGHSVLLTLMKKWPHRARVQGTCCGIVAAVIHNWQHDKQSMLFKFNIVEHLISMGFIEHASAALGSFPHDKYVQSSGISCLRNLLYLQNDEKTRKAGQKCIDLNCVALVSKAMHNFPLCCDLQSVGCGFLERLCNCGFSKAEVMKKDALVAVVHAVQQFPNNAMIEQKAYKCMTSIMKPARKPKND